ncbi:MAG: hypothetical protein V3U51_03165 [Thermoplasmata archaeon]
MSSGKAATLAILIFLAIVAALLLVLHFLGALLWAVAFLGLFVLIGLVVFIVAFGLVMIPLTFYYMLKKKPVVQEYGNYTLDGVKGKEDWVKKG